MKSSVLVAFLWGELKLFESLKALQIKDYTACLSLAWVHFNIEGLQLVLDWAYCSLNEVELFYDKAFLPVVLT